MNIKRFAVGFLTVFVIALLVNIGVTLLWGLVFHGVARIDWETSLRLALLFAIILPAIDSRRKSF
jgi:hypothetical protein